MWTNLFAFLESQQFSLFALLELFFYRAILTIYSYLHSYNRTIHIFFYVIRGHITRR